MPELMQELTAEQQAELENERRKIRDTIREMLKTVNDKGTTDTEEITKINQKLTGTLDELKNPQKEQDMLDAFESILSTFIIDVINFVQDKAEALREKLHNVVHKQPQQEQEQKLEKPNPYSQDIKEVKAEQTKQKHRGAERHFDFSDLKR